jgi:hypothetical protein
MLYHFGTRRLSFIKSTTLLSVLRQIGAATVPRPSADHSHRRVMVTIGRRPPLRSCDENPLAGFVTG